MTTDTLNSDKLNTVKMHPFLTEEEQGKITDMLITTL